MSTLTSAGLKKSFESKTVIHNVSLEVNSGEIVGLLGPNGAGKTTTFYMIVGLIKSDEGSIHVNGNNITHDPIHKRFEQGISYLPQEPSVFRDMTAKDNIEAILEVDKSLSKTQKSDILEHLIDKFDYWKSQGYKYIVRHAEVNDDLDESEIAHLSSMLWLTKNGNRKNFIENKFQKTLSLENILSFVEAGFDRAKNEYQSAKKIYDDVIENQCNTILFNKSAVKHNLEIERQYMNGITEAINYVKNKMKNRKAA